MARLVLFVVLVSILLAVWNVQVTSAARPVARLSNRFTKLSSASSASIPQAGQIASMYVAPVGTDVPLVQEPVHSFSKGSPKTITKGGEKVFLGGKGANLAEMSAIGLSVPPGFTITTEVCAAFHTAGKRLPKSVWPKVLKGLEKVEAEMGRKFGDVNKPLLVSVRSGAAISMPGMMDTVSITTINQHQYSRFII